MKDGPQHNSANTMVMLEEATNMTEELDQQLTAAMETADALEEELRAEKRARRAAAADVAQRLADASDLHAELAQVRADAAADRVVAEKAADDIAAVGRCRLTTG